MTHSVWKKLTAVLTVLLVQPLGVSFYYAETLPDSYYVRQDSSLELSTAFPVKVHPVEKSITAAAAKGTGSAAELRLFGIIPVKTVSVSPVSAVSLVPGGEAFGIRMLMDGIMVVGFGDVSTISGGCCPGEDAGLMEGDIIREVNRHPVKSTEDFRQLTSSGGTMTLTVLRGDSLLSLELEPAFSCEANCCQTGLWVKDSAAGIGTMTYCEPQTGKFGGLGHPICDPDTGEQIPLSSGEANAVTVSGVIPGQAGTPGQLQGYFSAQSPMGTLTLNSRCGVFGTLDMPVDASDAVPLALKQEIVTGDAEIISTADDNTPQHYKIRIRSLDYTDETRNMVIEITDPELLSRTGGIVQGMSGSPILQNGKLVGAVTHVFVDDPTSGYGIFAETMYDVTRSMAE